MLKQTLLTLSCVMFSLTGLANGGDVETEQSADVPIMAVEEPAVAAEMETEQAAKTPMAVQVTKLVDKPAQYVGKKIKLTGEVEEQKSAQSFVLDGEGWWDDEILVISKKTLATAAKTGAIKEDARVEVTGEVVQMSILDIEKQYGWDFDPEVEIELEKVKTYVIADDIRVTSAD